MHRLRAIFAKPCESSARFGNRFTRRPVFAGWNDWLQVDGPVATSVLVQDGTYSTDRAPIGNCVVTINTEAIKAGAGNMYVPIPEKYSDPKTSDLKVEIKPTNNEGVNFALEQ